MMQSIIGYTPEELVSICKISPSYRGLQLFQAPFQGIKQIADITSLPKQLRETLSKDFTLYSSKIVKILSDESAHKVKIKLADQKFIEAVILIDSKDRKTACLSTQLGCGMNCAFCKTGTMGLIRNLTAGEIIEQFLLLQEAFGEISNIVFMGMGEPLENYDAVKQSIKIFTHDKALNWSPRRITVSTVGVASNIKRLADDSLGVRLAVSLVSAIPETRRQLMPIMKRFDLDELAESIHYFQKKTSRRLTLEWVLLKGVNDSFDEIRALQKWSKGMNIMINLIPWNNVDELPFVESSEDSVDKFVAELTKRGFNVNRRHRKGSNIKGACGQLATE